MPFLEVATDPVEDGVRERPQFVRIPAFPSPLEEIASYLVID
ncbi:hypothetical protein GCM10027344_27770 [Spelaeicoccus albus]